MTVLNKAMKPSNSSGMFKPFKNLRALLDSKSLQLKPAPDAAAYEINAVQTDHRSEHEIFKEAMADVKKLSRSNCLSRVPPAHPPPHTGDTAECEPLIQLKNLVKYGAGFVVCLTPEYVEGMANGVPPEIARRLHRGDFSIQAHFDLHGLGVQDAHEAFDAFLNRCVTAGKRAVLIIHGRGLSSPSKPVLKSKVFHWLTTSPWHRWVIAFTSARLCDGGTGATYVLLRQKPLTKRLRKKMKR
jgi:DNA-nicking Smr family endonuclease